MEDHHHHLLRPLLPCPRPPTTTTIAYVDITITANTSIDVNFGGGDNNTINLIPSNSRILLRLFSVAVVGLLSIWANHEASKGFEINIENRATIDSIAAGHKFQLFYVSNDKATRLVLNATKFIETILYPNSQNSSTQPKKRVDRVTLRLASGRNRTHMVTVDSFNENEFVLNLSPSIMELTKFDRAMATAVQRGMARVWIYDNNAPQTIINGMVEYISSRLADLGVVSNSSTAAAAGEWPESEDSCWKDENPRAVARFLNYCEESRKGFIQRLNQAMRGRWHNRSIDDALGMPAQHLCGSYMSSQK